jgi:hypothetical protein
MLTQDPLNVPKFWVSLVGLFLSVVAGIVAFASFRRSEKWKRAEFLAKEMKDFFEDERVQKALQFIDWGARRVQLLPPENKDSGFVRVTRGLQVSALRPHTFLKKGALDPEMADSDTEMIAPDDEMTGKWVVKQGETFRPEEVVIRDCYDTLLDGLERFSSYVKTGLIEVRALRPYIGYWIDDIHAPTSNQTDAAWTAALLTYISFYRFKGVLDLFKAFDRRIDPSSEAYRGFLTMMRDQDYAAKLADSVNTKTSPRFVYWVKIFGSMKRRL